VPVVIKSPTVSRVPAVRLLALAAGTIAAATSLTTAQTCGGQWQPGFALTGLASTPWASVVFDSGTGPTPHVAVGARVFRLVNGQWVQLGGNFLGNLTGPITGAGGDVRALVAFNDGSGLKLYAAGTFQRGPGGIVTRNICRFNPATQAWEAFGPGTTTGTSPTRGITNYAVTPNAALHYVFALCVHDEDGPGPIAPALFAAGRFSAAGTTTARGIVRWTGSTWQALSGPSGQGHDNNSGANALVSIDLDGSGPQLPSLIVGGTFQQVGILGGGLTKSIAAWRNGDWASLGQQIPADVRSLAAFDPDGTGPLPSTLVAGLQADAGVVAYDPSAQTWSPLGGGVPGVVLSLLSEPSPSGDTLLVGGNFPTVDLTTPVVAPSLARWTPATGWSPVGNGFYNNCGNTGPSTPTNSVTTVTNFDPDGPGPLASRPYAFGLWQSTGSGRAVQNNATLDLATNTWGPIAPGQGATGNIRAFHAFDPDGEGPLSKSLFATYNAGALGEIESTGLGRWDNATRTWVKDTPCGGPIDLGAVTSAFDGTAERLFVLADNPDSGIRVVRNGVLEAFPPPPGVRFGSSELFSGDIVGVDFDGPGPQPTALFATSIDTSDLSTRSVYRWNGSAWSGALGTFSKPGAITGMSVLLTVADTGTGPQLYASGDFSELNGVPIRSMARFDPATSTFVAIDAGLTTPTRVGRPVAATFGGVTRLYAPVNRAPGLGAFAIAAFDATTWTDVIAQGRLTFLLNGLVDQGGSVDTLTFFNDGAGPALFIKGSFNALDGALISPRIARWNGTTIASVGAGMTGNIAAPAITYDDGTGPALWIGSSSSITPASTGLAVLKRVACPCGPSDIAGPGPTPGADGELTADDVILFINAFTASNLAIADIAGPGPSVGADGELTADDVILFITRFTAGC
jgi:hypothetical protein